MSRTRLRGIELGGSRVAIEVPASVEWSWPGTHYEPFVCAPEGAQVYVGVRAGTAPGMPRDGFVYQSASHRFEVAERGDGWIVAVYGPHGLERTALFDAGFSEGEVILSPAAATSGIAPLEHPLDELLVLHRTVRGGGLVLRGSLVQQADRALLFLGARSPSGTDSREPQLPRRQSGAELPRAEQLVVLQMPDGARAVGAPWTRGTGPSGRFTAHLDGMHSIRPARAVFADRLDRDDAVTELMEHALAPIHDPLCAARCFDAAAAIVDRVPVVRLGLPEAKRVVSYTWGRSEKELAFAPPFSS